MTQALLVGVVLAVLSPIAARYASRWTNKDRRERAFRRITREPYYQRGMPFLRVELQGHPTPLLGRGHIENVAVGRVVLHGEGGEVLVVTGEELERLWIVSARAA